MGTTPREIGPAALPDTFADAASNAPTRSTTRLRARRALREPPSSHLRALLAGALGAVSVAGCCVWSRWHPERERDIELPVDPEVVAQAAVDRDGFADQAACLRACARLSGELRTCRFEARQVETPAAAPAVECRRFPADGGPDHFDHSVEITEERSKSLKLRPDGSLASGCFEFCRAPPGEGMGCRLRPGRPNVAKVEHTVFCRILTPAGCGPVTFGN